MTGILRPAVRVFPDIESMSRAAADFVLSLARDAIDSRNRFTFAISGGATPKRLYEFFSSAPFREIMMWPNIHLFWADERCVPKDDPESNYRLARDTFLSRVSLPEQNVHRIQGERDPASAARIYEGDLRSFFGGSDIPALDLVLLGAGRDGHTASLFPGSAATRERKRLVLPVYLDPPMTNRVTLTLPVLNHASSVIFMAAGSAKAAVVHEIIEDANPKNYPAGLVQPVHGSVFWMLDKDAASALTDVSLLKLMPS